MATEKSLNFTSLGKHFIIAVQLLQKGGPPGPPGPPGPGGPNGPGPPPKQSWNNQQQQRQDKLHFHAIKMLVKLMPKNQLRNEKHSYIKR